MINIAELLKDAPKGLKLYSPLFGEVEFMQLGKNDQIWIKVDNSEPFDKYGRYFGSRFTDAECLLFPSKDCRTWEGWKSPVKPKSKVGTWLWHKTKGVFPLMVEGYDEKEGYLMQFTDETKCYFGRDIIENDYRLWEISDARNGDVLVLNGFSKEYKWIGIFKAHTSDTSFSSHCHYNCGMCEFVTDIARCTEHNTKYNDIRPATNEERHILFAKMKEAGYEWDAEKKELKEFPKHYDISNFKPKQWVLVRDCDNQVWGLSMFSHRDMGCYICINRVDFRQCIPFEGNEKLLGTTNPCDKRYINW